MDIEVFRWLQQWYLEQCNEEWEHRYGITMSTIDNPGWKVEIDLVGTALEGANFSKILIERRDDNWVMCEVKDGQFQAACGPMNLTETLNCFRQWATGQTASL